MPHFDEKVRHTDRRGITWDHKDPYKGLTYADALVIKLVKG